MKQRLRSDGWLLLVAAVLGLIAYWSIPDRPQPLPAPVTVVKERLVPVVRHHTNLVEVVRTNHFQWAQLESEDYRTYIARLKAIGCPEQTIRDIIIADVEKLLSPRLQELNPKRGPLAYWKPEEKELEDPLQYLEAAGHRMEIDFEKRDIIRELVGVDPAEERAQALGETDRYSQRLAFLPTEKRLEIRKIMERYNRAEAALREERWSEYGELTREDEAALRQLEQRREAEVAGLLTPTEFRQYELQLSPLAYQVRDAFFGMNPTEQEFLAVFDARKSFQQQFPGEAAESDRAQIELKLKLQQALGAGRYREYERAQDPEFRELTVAVVRNGLPRDLAGKAYEIKQATLKTAQLLERRNDLSDEQKELVWQSITQEARGSISGLLGDRAFQQFLRTSTAEWLRE